MPEYSSLHALVDKREFTTREIYIEFGFGDDDDIVLDNFELFGLVEKDFHVIISSDYTEITKELLQKFLNICSSRKCYIYNLTAKVNLLHEIRTTVTNLCILYVDDNNQYDLSKISAVSVEILNCYKNVKYLKDYIFYSFGINQVEASIQFFDGCDLSLNNVIINCRRNDRVCDLSRLSVLEKLEIKNCHQQSQSIPYPPVVVITNSSPAFQQSLVVPRYVQVSSNNYTFPVRSEMSVAEITPEVAADIQARGLVTITWQGQGPVPAEQLLLLTQRPGLNINWRRATAPSINSIFDLMGDRFPKNNYHYFPHMGAIFGGGDTPFYDYCIHSRLHREIENKALQDRMTAMVTINIPVELLKLIRSYMMLPDSNFMSPHFEASAHAETIMYLRIQVDLLEDDLDDNRFVRVSNLARQVNELLQEVRRIEGLETLVDELTILSQRLRDT